MRSLILHNEKAGFSSDAIYMFVRSITHPGDSCEFRSLSDGWNAEDAFKDAEEFDQVVISGGDGTAASLLYAAKDKDLNVCVFPSGTANLFFSNLGNSPEPAAVARACRDIFREELLNNYEQVLSAMVHSRVKIMHIKREQRGVYFDGRESVLYAAKMSLLYRRIMFEVLGIDEEVYKEKLVNCVTKWNNWNDVLKNFLQRLPR